MLLNQRSWLRCNRCAANSSEKGLCLTKCGHIFCQICLGEEHKSVDVICFTCKKNTQIKEINSKLEDEKLFYFKDPEELMDEYKKKVDKVREFQNCQREIAIKVMLEKYEKATGLLKLAIKGKEEIKSKTMKIAKFAKESREIIKKKDDDIKYLKSKIVELTQSAVKYRENGKKLEEKIKKIHNSSQKCEEKSHSNHNNSKTNSIYLKRRLNDEDDINNKSKFKHNDISENPLFESNIVTQSNLRSSKPSECKKVKKVNIENIPPQFIPSMPPIPKFDNAKNFFSQRTFDENSTFKYSFAGNESERDLNFSFLNDPKKVFQPKTTSTQNNDNTNPSISLNASGISEIPNFNTSKL